MRTIISLADGAQGGEALSGMVVGMKACSMAAPAGESGARQEEAAAADEPLDVTDPEGVLSLFAHGWIRNPGVLND